MSYQCGRCGCHCTGEPSAFDERGTGLFSAVCYVCEAPKAKALDPTILALILQLVSLIIQYWLANRTAPLRSRLFPRWRSAKLARLDAKGQRLEAWKTKQDRDQRAFGNGPDLDELRQIVEGE
jgi:hypothetical protein